ncbi:MAG: UDP-glucose 6-dehydrogenase [Rhodospirillales bacterium]|jgi:UDPglucose 6-dehydrogenase|nr:UDP-glucose 6-dehydrogenase [Rhodospirillales bacterium]
MKLSVFGLGKLGSPMAVVFASRGHEVVGVDVNERAVDFLNRGMAPIEETGLQDLMASLDGRLRATIDGEQAIVETDLSILIVPTPSEADGGFALATLLAAAEVVGRGLARRNAYHVVVVASTILPGAVEREIIPALERASGKRRNVDFGICYSPEFVALGNVIHDILRPDIVLIGEGDARAGGVVEAFYRGTVENSPAFLHMNIVNAEIAKLAVNTYVTTKISFANMLADICERIPGADAYVVTRAIGRDSRIGGRFILPGAAYGGPCFPRDNKALSYFAQSLGTHALLAEATDEVNRNQNSRLVDLVLSNLPKGGQVGILGMSYKADAVIGDESAGYHLAIGLVAKRVAVNVYDPAAMDHAKNLLGNQVTYAASANACIAQSNVIVVTTPWKAFADLAYPSGSIVIDCWRMLDPSKLDPSITYFALGRGTIDRALI